MSSDGGGDTGPCSGRPAGCPGQAGMYQIPVSITKIPVSIKRGYLLGFGGFMM